jgi:RHS repeat-associated protein
VSLSSPSAFNPYQFAGEQRDTTGLDYLRARYYDPTLGRFISKDAYAGSLGDPMSQHDYQYAHANPVNYTDPTGYFTVQEALATVAVGSILASLSASGGYVAGSYLSGDGPNGEELLNMADQWVAGFAHFVSFGASTHIRSSRYGDTATQNHSGFLWNMGNLAGAGMSLLMGAQVPEVVSFNMGRSQWLATAYEGASWGSSAWQTGSHIREGRLEWTDAFNLLPFASYGMSSQGVKAFLATAEDVNDRLRDWGRMEVNASVQTEVIEDTSTVFRVQGGTPPLASRHHIRIDADGNVKINKTTVCISIGDLEHAQYFLDKRPGAEIFSFDIPKWMDEFIDGEAIEQFQYGSNPLNQDRQAPKIVDPTTPGRSYELPPIWAEWLEEVAVPESGKIIR